jgi:hypothetical protein
MKVAEVLQRAVSKAVGEKVLPSQNVCVEFVERNEFDTMAQTLDVRVTAPGEMPITADMGYSTYAGMWSSNIARDFVEGMGESFQGPMLVTVTIPLAMVTHKIS